MTRLIPAGAFGSFGEYHVPVARSDFPGEFPVRSPAVAAALLRKTSACRVVQRKPARPPCASLSSPPCPGAGRVPQRERECGPRRLSCPAGHFRGHRSLAEGRRWSRCGFPWRGNPGTAHRRRWGWRGAASGPVPAGPPATCPDGRAGLPACGAARPGRGECPIPHLMSTLSPARRFQPFPWFRRREGILSVHAGRASPDRLRAGRTGSWRRWNRPGIPRFFQGITTRN